MSTRQLKAGRFELIPIWLPIARGAASLVAGGGVAYGVSTWTLSHHDLILKDHETRIRNTEEQLPSIANDIKGDIRAIRQALEDRGYHIVPKNEK